MSAAIVFDLEFTAWAGSLESRWLRPGEFKEVVQIGAIKVDAESWDEIAPFDALVRPRINPTITAYLETLTGITNAAIAARLGCVETTVERKLRRIRNLWSREVIS